MLARSLAALAIVLGVIYVAYKYVLVHFGQPPSTSRSLKVTERLVLEPQAALYLIQGRKKGWLVGVSNRQISLLDQIPLEDMKNNEIKPAP